MIRISIAAEVLRRDRPDAPARVRGLRGRGRRQRRDAHLDRRQAGRQARSDARGGRELQRRYPADRGAGGQIRWLTGTMRARRSTPFSGSSKRTIMRLARTMVGRQTTPRTRTRTRCGELITSARSAKRSMPSSTPASNPSSAKSSWGSKIENLFDPIIQRFDHRSDREFWELIVPVDASAGLTGRKVGQVQDALIKWIAANAALVPVAPLHDRRANPPLGESADGVPFRFSLHRASLEGPYYPSDSPLCGRFKRMGVAPADLEQQRAARLKTASERKSPKLAKWKMDSGARTVLVLEEDDLQLTNHFRVADALVPAEATTPDAPDEVFLVSTCIEQTWWVVCLRGPGRVAGEPMPSANLIQRNSRNSRRGDWRPASPPPHRRSDHRQRKRKAASAAFFRTPPRTAIASPPSR